MERWEDFDGYGVGHGFDPADLSLPRLCNFTWWWVTSGDVDPKEVEKFRTRLWRPLPGMEVSHAQSPWSAENENKAFQSLKQALGT